MVPLDFNAGSALPVKEPLPTFLAGPSAREQVIGWRAASPCSDVHMVAHRLLGRRGRLQSRWLQLPRSLRLSIDGRRDTEADELPYRHHVLTACENVLAASATSVLHQTTQQLDENGNGVVFSGWVLLAAVRGATAAAVRLGRCLHLGSRVRVGGKNFASGVSLRGGGGGD